MLYIKIVTVFIILSLRSVPKVDWLPMRLFRKVHFVINSNEARFCYFQLCCHDPDNPLGQGPISLTLLIIVLQNTILQLSFQ